MLAAWTHAIHHVRRVDADAHLMVIVRVVLSCLTGRQHSTSISLVAWNHESGSRPEAQALIYLGASSQSEELTPHLFRGVV